MALWLDGSVPMMIMLLTGWNPSRCGMTESRQAGVVTWMDMPGEVSAGGAG
jgi:hypothetical protein